MPVFTVSRQWRWYSERAEEGLGFGQVRGEERESWLSGAGCFAVSYASQVPRLCEPTQKKRHREAFIFHQTGLRCLKL